MDKRSGPTRVLILSVEAGYGHRKVAEAIREELGCRTSEGFQVTVCDALQKTNWLFRNTYAPIYQKMVTCAPWVWGFFFWLTDLPAVYRWIAPLRSLWNWCQSAPLRAYLKEVPFDFVVFTHFFPAEVGGTLKRRGLLRGTLITVVTDVVPHLVWQNRGTDYYWVMAEESRQRLLERGSSPGQVLVGGIPISPAFLEKKDRTTLMNQFGLSRERFTILFTSGSFGIGPTEAVLDSFKELKDRIQVMVVCGKNESLFDALNRRRFPFVTILFGLVHNMPEIMSVTDLLIAKPGGATTCESLAKRVPMIVLGAIPGQEVHNAEWLLGRRAAFHAKRVEEVRAVVLHILNHPHALAQAREAAARLAKPAAAKALVDFICERKSLQVQEHS